MEDEEHTEEEYAEIPYEEESARTMVMIETLDGFNAVDNIILSVKAGNIVLAKIKSLKEDNMDELKHCISKLKTAVANMGGDIVGIGEEFVLVTPRAARIERV